MLQKTQVVLNKFPFIKYLLTLAVLAVMVFAILQTNFISGIPNIQGQGQTERYEHFQAKVTGIIDEKNQEGLIDSQESLLQTIKAVATSGSLTNQSIEFNYSLINANKTEQKVKVGDQVILAKNFNGNKETYNFISFDRSSSLIVLAILFIIIAVIVAGFKGFTALIGLVASIGGIGLIIIPRILAGDNPFLVCLVGCFVIAFVNIYLGHGINKRSTIALGGIFVALILAGITAPLVTEYTRFLGIAGDDAFNLQFWNNGSLDLKGLFVGAVLIGTLGVLDDVATAQVAAVEEVHKANPKLNFTQLFSSGMSVGREHIISVVNTLALAYVGVSLPLILSFIIGNGQPWWVIINSDIIVEELIRTLVGSFCLILAVPVCNLLACLIYANRRSYMDNKVYRVD